MGTLIMFIIACTLAIVTLAKLFILIFNKINCINCSCTWTAHLTKALAKLLNSLVSIWHKKQINNAQAMIQPQITSTASTNNELEIPAYVRKGNKIIY